MKMAAMQHNWFRVFKKFALAVSVIGLLSAFPSYAGTYAAGECIEVTTGLSGDYGSMTFVCLDEDYEGGCLFVADEVIPYSEATRYAASNNDYSLSDARTWLNQYFTDTLSVADDILPIRLAEADDSVSDRVFCLSIDEVRNPVYKELLRGTWTPKQGTRYYWTRSRRENTENMAYLVQYNGHIASSRVSLTQAGLRPAFVLAKEEADTGQGKIWYEGDTQERSIHGITYTFRCIDPNYCDAGKNRAGALFLCDSIIGGDQCVFDENHNGWSASNLRVRRRPWRIPDLRAAVPLRGPVRPSR